MRAGNTVILSTTARSAWTDHPDVFTGKEAVGHRHRPVDEPNLDFSSATPERHQGRQFHQTQSVHAAARILLMLKS
jgi:hypothetical protein